MRFLFWVLMAAAWRLRRCVACAGVLVVGVHPACGGDAALHLENARIAVAIDPQSGAVHSIRDKQLDVAYPQTGIGFEIETAAGILDRLKEAGVHDVMTAHTWYGRGNHPGSPPYIDRMRIEPMGFPKDSGISSISTTSYCQIGPGYGEDKPGVSVFPAFTRQLPRSPLQAPVVASTNEDELKETHIVNGTDWLDTEGRPIVAHEGDLARFDGVFYWYGSSYAGNPSGNFDISDGPVWNGVQVYRSTDLKNWEYRGVCLPRPENGFGKLGATGRGHVIYNEKTKKYVMWYRWYLHVPASFLMVAVADHPEGPFTSLGPREMGTSNGFASDMNVLKDDDGKAYVIYCDHGGHGVKGDTPLYAIRIDSLSDDYLTSNQDGVVVFEKGCESPAMIRYKGKYIAVASGVHGWAGSETVCATGDSPLGPWTRQADISEQKTWNSQVSDLIYLEESDTVMALCDQWWIPDKSDINKSRYLFLPVTMDPATGTVRMEYREKWKGLKTDAATEAPRGLR